MNIELDSIEAELLLSFVEENFEAFEKMSIEKGYNLKIDYINELLGKLMECL